MKQTSRAVKHWILGISVLVCLGGMSTAALAEMLTVTYTLEDVWLLPDTSHPFYAAQQMTGTFEWTYDTTDAFANGSGQFIDVFLPWYNPGMENLNFNVDLTSIEITLVGNYHDRGVDLTLFLLESLSPDQSVAIDTVRSAFDIQYAVSYQGHVVSGYILPATDIDADGWPDNADNCPDNCNTSQSDADADGIGDVCDGTPGCGGVSCGVPQPACEESCGGGGCGG
jgi:hypothetical protein